jgi:predicted dinucleotide-binding enzyme
MDIGVMGTGMVGTTIAARLEELGHGVRSGGRGSFADVASFGELVFNCTAGAGAVNAVGSAASELEGKVLIDVSNPLEFSGDGPPGLFVGLDDSLGERVQRAAPHARVVKALNTVNCDVMVHPELVPGDHAVFVCGDDGDAKSQVTELLGEFGWGPHQVTDLGDISGARATEGYLLLWLRLMGVEGGARFNIEIRS